MNARFDPGRGLTISVDQSAVKLALFKALRYIPNNYMVIGLHDPDDDMDIIGGFVIDRYTGKGGSCFLHYVGFRNGWFTRRVILFLANYLWRVVECRVVYGEVRARDTYVRDLDERLGFRQIAYLRGAYPDDDCVLYELRREDCKWLKLLERMEA